MKIAFFSALISTIVIGHAQAALTPTENWRCCPSTQSPLMVERNACAETNDRTDLILRVTSGTLERLLQNHERGVFQASPANKNNFDPYTFVGTDLTDRTYGKHVEIYENGALQKSIHIYQYYNDWSKSVENMLKVNDRSYDCIKTR